jgi:hypothetical protein
MPLRRCKKVKEWRQEDERMRRKEKKMQETLLLNICIPYIIFSYPITK